MIIDSLPLSFLEIEARGINFNELSADLAQITYLGVASILCDPWGLVYLPTFYHDFLAKCRHIYMPYMDPMGIDIYIKCPVFFFKVGPYQI